MCPCAVFGTGLKQVRDSVSRKKLERPLLVIRANRSDSDSNHVTRLVAWGVDIFHDF
jgi:hypothetical protein